MRRLLLFFVSLILLSVSTYGGNGDGRRVDGGKVERVPYFERDYSGRGAYLLVEPEFAMVLQPHVDGYKVPAGTVADQIYRAKVISGWRFSNYFSLGAGLGVSTKSLSAFIDARSHFLKGPISPYVGLQIGVGVGCGTMFLFMPSVGAKFIITDWFGMSMYCGYQPPFGGYGSSVAGLPDVDPNIITVGFGCHFDFRKKAKPSILKLVEDKKM